VNIETRGIPTVCVVTSAFQTIAEAQQKALGYPDLPFVMLEHPVAVATDDEIGKKVEAIYANLVLSLSSSISSAGRSDEIQRENLSNDASISQTSTGKVFRSLNEAIAPIRKMLNADGADLAVLSNKNRKAAMELIFFENVCEDCILPGKDLTKMLAASCRENGHDISEVLLQDPREAT